jgi:MATE family multidrug resistance protein
MVKVGTRRDEVRRLLELGIPAALTQLGWMMLGVVDTLMVGQLGVYELDAAALGNIWTFGTLVFGMGVLLGMDPIIAQAHGSGDHDRVARSLHHGMVLAVVLGVPIGASWLFTEEVMIAFGQEPALAAGAERYVAVQIWSVVPFLGFHALRQYLQGRGIVAPALWAVLFGNLFNVAANWALIFGRLGMPAMGLYGAGLATAATRVFLLVGLAIFVWRFRLHREAWRRPGRDAFDRASLRAILRLGIPVGIQYGLEGWAFQIATLLAGRLSQTALAAHVIALNLASAAFMLPLGLSIGASTRVGNLVGAGHHAAAQRAAMLAMAMGAGVMGVTALLFLFLRDELPRMFTPDPAAIATAASILPIAAAFALFDGTQAVGAGVLRGLGRTTPAMLFNIVAFYVLGLPAATGLAFGLDLGVRGLWWGLALGLAAVAIALVVYVHRRGPGHDAPPPG